MKIEKNSSILDSTTFSFYNPDRPSRWVLRESENDNILQPYVVSRQEMRLTTNETWEHAGYFNESYFFAFDKAKIWFEQLNQLS